MHVRPVSEGTSLNTEESDKAAAAAAALTSGALPRPALVLWQRALRHERIPDDSPYLDLLLTLGLLVPASVEPGRYTAVPLEVFERRATATALDTLQETLDKVRGLHILMGSLSREGCTSTNGIEYVYGCNVNYAIDEKIEGASHSLLTAQPGGARSPKKLAYSWERDSKAIRRGVAMRTLYHSSAIAPGSDGTATREWVDYMTGLGAQVRLLAAPFTRLIVIDESTAFIPSFHTPPEKGSAPAWIVTAPAMVAFIVEVFNLAWDRAEPWQADRSDDQGTGPVTTQQERSILRSLVAGRTYEVIARELSVSVSRVKQALGALRRRLAELGEFQTVPTRDQVIYWWATSREQHLD